MSNENQSLLDDGDSQLSLLATLLHLARRARHTSNLAELRFLLVNETHALIPFRQAAFWTINHGVETLSGVTEIERHAPYVQWLTHWFSSTPSAEKVRAFPSDLRLLKDASSLGWEAWLPPHVLSVQFPAQHNFPGARLLLARDEAFQPSEISVIEEWCDIWFDHYVKSIKSRWYDGFTLKRVSIKQRRSRVTLLITAIMLAVSAMPVSLSVLAPAELIPLKPLLVRSPMDGVIDTMFIEANEQVSTDAPLFEFDRVSIDSRYELAQRTLETAKATYRQNAQLALSNSETKSELAVLRNLIAEKQVEVDYLQQLIERSLVVAEQSGLVIINDVSEWIGRPVVTGEVVLALADEHEVQIEAWLSPEDMVDFPEATQLKLFLSADPLTPLEARVNYIAHEAELRPEGTYAHRVRATLIAGSDSSRMRIGLKGTARMEGPRVSLAYWVFRRPLAKLRGWLGL